MTAQLRKHIIGTKMMKLQLLLVRVVWVRRERDEFIVICNHAGKYAPNSPPIWNLIHELLYSH